MAQTIKIHIITMDIVEVKEVGLEEARRLVEESYNQGYMVVDKETGNIIDDIASNTRELFIVGVLGGG